MQHHAAAVKKIPKGKEEQRIRIAAMEWQVKSPKFPTMVLLSLIFTTKLAWHKSCTNTWLQVPQLQWVIFLIIFQKMSDEQKKQPFRDLLKKREQEAAKKAAATPKAAKRPKKAVAAKKSAASPKA